MRFLPAMPEVGLPATQGLPALSEVTAQQALLAIVEQPDRQVHQA